MGRDFLYYLVREDGQFCIVQDGAVVLTSTPTPLTYTPDRWLDIEIFRGRNTKYFGVERSVSAPLDFVKDGAFILKYYYYTKGIEDKLYLLIAEKRLYLEDGGFVAHEQSGSVDTETPGVILTETIPGYFYYYTAIYKGEINFSQLKHAGPKVTVEVIEGGASKLLKANEAVKYEIPMINENIIAVRMDGVRLQQKASYIITNGALESDLAGHTLDVQFATADALSSIGAVSEERIVTGNETSELWNTGTYFLQTGSRDTTLTLNFDLTVTPRLADGVGSIFGTKIFLQLHVLQSADDRISNDNIAEAGGGDPLLLYGQPQRMQGSFTTTVPANCRCVLYMTSTNSQRDFTFFTYDSENSSLSIDYTHTQGTTDIRAMRVATLFKLLAAKMGITKTRSTLLAGYTQLVVTSGNAIRGLDTPSIFTTFADFYQSLQSVVCAGVGIEGDVLVLEHKSYFASTANPVFLGECKDLKVSPATDFIYNTLKIGYQEQEYDDVNGKYEFNNTHVYSFPVTRITKELNLVSPYRADSYGIEFLRINLDGKTTTDNQSDNDVFFLHIKKKPATGPFVVFEYYELDRTLNAYATGLQEPTAFNLWLSPKQCLFRNSGFIHSLFFNQESDRIVFQSTEKNSSLAVAAPGVRVVIENANVEISQLDGRFFRPMLFEFETKVPGILTGSCCSFINDGVLYTGLTIKDAYKPASKAAQTFQLLAAPSVDAKTLIDYDG